MLHSGPHPGATENELSAIAKLRDKNPVSAISYTRSGPEESGPLLVYVDDITYTVQGDGSTRKKAK